MSGGWKGKSQSSRRDELPADWPALRKAQLEEDNYRCVWQLPSGKRCNLPATDVDHYGEKWEHHKLRSLCGPHHDKRTSEQGNDAKRRPPPRRRPPEQHPGLV